MYEAFYGFKEKPFSMLPDPGFLYLSKKHQAALTLLEYGLLNHVGFCVISGEAGAGKTTILRALLERIGDDITVGLITNTHQSFGGLLDWVLSSFDLHRPNLTHVEMHQIFMEYLIEEYAKGHTVLLIVDEAQNMKPDALEELRMLSNVNSEKDQLMQVVLSGQPSLRETLRLPDLMQFAQRIAVDYHLDSLNLKETCGYIQHRLITAGAQKDVFTPAACERIHNYSGGTPRLINLLCETVLVYGFADQQELIDVDLVDEMVLERMKDSVVPIVNREIAKQDNSEASKALEKDFPWISHGKGGAEKKEVEINDVGNVDVEDEPQGIEEDVKPAAQNAAKASEPSRSKISDEKVASVRVEQKQVKQKPAEKKQAAAKVNKVDDVIRSRQGKKQEPSTDKNETRQQLVKYGSISAVIAVILITFASMLGDDEAVVEQDVAKDAEQSVQLQEQQVKREQDEKQLRELQIQAATLKKERDAAIARAEEERKAKQAVEKQAAAKAVAAAKVAAEKRRLEEKKQIDAAKARERRAKKAEARAREEAERAKRETAKLEAERREMKARLEEERRLNEAAAARRLELEREEALRQKLQAAKDDEAAADAAAAAEAAKKSKSAECTGPTARFKAGCR